MPSAGPAMKPRARFASQRFAPRIAPRSSAGTLTSGLHELKVANWSTSSNACASSKASSRLLPGQRLVKDCKDPSDMLPHLRSDGSRVKGAATRCVGLPADLSNEFVDKLVDSLRLIFVPSSLLNGVMDSFGPARITFPALLYADVPRLLPNLFVWCEQLHCCAHDLADLSSRSEVGQPGVVVQVCQRLINRVCK